MVSPSPLQLSRLVPCDVNAVRSKEEDCDGSREFRHPLWKFWGDWPLTYL